MRRYPALDLRWATPPDESLIDLALAEIDDDRPIAVEFHHEGVRVFFHGEAERATATARIKAFDPDISTSSVDVPDEDWAERSQASLTPVRVGRFLVGRSQAAIDEVIQHAPDRPQPVIAIVINPSMGFGTGHHASTRTCLSLLQQIPLENSRVIDVGTGSGVLAIAAWRAGARRVVAADSDPDAAQSAAENVSLNGAEHVVEVRHWDLGAASNSADASQFDLVLANLTGALLERQAAGLVALLSPGGRLIVSGFQDDEVATVTAAFATAGATVVQRVDEDAWVGLVASVSAGSASLPAPARP